MIVLTAGVPRSGTVLVNAIVRTLLVENGVSVIQKNPHGKELVFLLQRLIRSGMQMYKVVLVHTHTWNDECTRLVENNAHLVGFLNYRDPRDVCVSLIQLHELAFESAIQAVEQYFSVFETVAMKLKPTLIPYELLVPNKHAFIFQIAQRLGLWPRLDQLATVEEQTSLEKHRNVMEDVQLGKIETTRERQNLHRTLYEDATTLISDRHIQSGVSGRWRTELTEDQQAELNKRFEPLLVRYGYQS